MTHLRRAHGRSATAATAVIALALPLAACSGGDDARPPGAEVGDGTAETSEPPEVSPSGPDRGDGAASTPRTDGTVFDAVDLAETVAGGTAFEVERENPDDGVDWEIAVAVDGEEVVVMVTPDGTEVLGSHPDGSVSADDQAGLDAAAVSLSQAITVALGEVEGVLDEVGLERYSDGYAWEVSVDGADGHHTDVHVDVATGEVLTGD